MSLFFCFYTNELDNEISSKLADYIKVSMKVSKKDGMDEQTELNINGGLIKCLCILPGYIRHSKYQINTKHLIKLHKWSGRYAIQCEHVIDFGDVC